MQKFLGRLLALILVLLPAVAFPATWNIDPDHSNLQFSVKHLMISNVKGTFGDVEGMAEIDDKDITKSTVKVTIQTGSVNTGVALRDADLKSANFFDVVKFPTMTFVSKKVVKSGKNKLKVTGDLTIHGVTKPVVLDVTGPSAESKDPWGKIRRGASATTKINRKDFGLTWNKALESGGVVVGDDVLISLEVEMIKAPGK
jgi:polyisoprenoid-binding protein YceI